jgi:hypothetical protein
MEPVTLLIAGIGPEVSPVSGRPAAAQQRSALHQPEAAIDAPVHEVGS